MVGRTSADERFPPISSWLSQSLLSLAEAWAGDIIFSRGLSPLHWRPRSLPCDPSTCSSIGGGSGCGARQCCIALRRTGAKEPATASSWSPTVSGGNGEGRVGVGGSSTLTAAGGGAGGTVCACAPPSFVSHFCWLRGDSNFCWMRGDPTFTSCFPSCSIVVLMRSWRSSGLLASTRGNCASSRSY